MGPRFWENVGERSTVEFGGWARAIATALAHYLLFRLVGLACLVGVTFPSQFDSVAKKMNFEVCLRFNSYWYSSTLYAYLTCLSVISYHRFKHYVALCV